MPRRQRVLIVEDDVDLRRMYRQVLTFGGYDVHEAGDGLAALRLIDADPPDGVILELALPIVSGLVVRQEIAAQAHTRQIPVIIVTGQIGDHGHLEAACVLQKPVSPERLLRTVQSCLASGGASFTKP